MPGIAALAPFIPKITAAGTGLLKSAGLLKTGIGLGIGSAIGIPWVSDSLTRGAIDKYKKALKDGTESTLERTNAQGNVEMNVNPVVGLFVDEEKIDDRAKKELTRQVYSQNDLVQQRAAALGLTEDDIGYNASAFLAKTQKAFDEKESLEEAFRELRGIPDNQSVYARLKQSDAKSDEVWQAVTNLHEKRRRDPRIVGSDAYRAEIDQETRGDTNQFRKDMLGLQSKELGLQGDQIRNTNSIAELGIIQSMLQSQQARRDSIDNRNLQLQLREFDREDRREDRLDRLDENKRKEKMAMIQMLVRGLTEASSSFGRY